MVNQLVNADVVLVGIRQTLVQRLLQQCISTLRLLQLLLQTADAHLVGCQLLFGILVVGRQLFILGLTVLQFLLAGTARCQQTNGSHSENNRNLSHNLFLFIINR